MRILAVDDDPVILDLLNNALNKVDHYDLICCGSAEEAQDIMRSDPEYFDCFLLDIMLPGIDGIELCETLRHGTTYRTTPIIMITASKAPDLMGRAFMAGATDFVSKPLNGVELGARINSASMLNDSLRRERAAQHSLAELSKASKIGFEEAIYLETGGVTDLMALENDLLRLPTGGYGMNLFCIDMQGLRGVHRVVDGAAFRQNLEHVAAATTAALNGSTWKLAYAGGGRFVGMTFSRLRLKRDALMEQIETTLAENWDAETCGVQSAPELRMSAVTDQRILSGLSASDKIRAYMETNDLTDGLGLADEDYLFGQFERRIAAE